MPAAPSTPLIAGAQGIVVAALFLALGWLVARTLVAPGSARRPAQTAGPGWPDGLEPVGLAVFGFALVGLGAMVLHIITRGLIFATPWLTRASIGVVFAALALLELRRSTTRRGGPNLARTRLLAAVVACAGVLVWGSTVVLTPLTLGGDTGLHSGWTSQLLNGEATPSGTLTGEIPNFYPWLFHGTLALLARFTPGGRPYHALVPMQLLLAGGTILALFQLGRTIGRRAATGAWAALFGGLTGGFGFLLARGFDIVMDPRSDALAYGGDLLFRRSYNASFVNLVPPLPRDLAFATFVSFLVLLIAGLQRQSRRVLVGAGIALGLTGLAGAESFFLGGGVALVMALWPGEVAGRRVASATLAPAAGIYSLWAVPQVWSYIRLGGFVNITVAGPVNLPPYAVLISWGIVTPAAVYGFVRGLAKVRSDPGARVVMSVTVVAAALLVSSLAVTSLFGDAFTSLGRPHRYWPGVSLGLALWAALGASEIMEAVSRKSKSLAALLAVAVIAVALPSPIVASVALGEEIGHYKALNHAVRGEKESLLNLMVPGHGGRCTAAVPLDLDSAIWAYTGYRLVMYTVRLPHPGNQARIRWRDIEEHITPESRRLKDNRILVEGAGSPARWREVARRYNVDMVVVPNARAGAPELRPYRLLAAADKPYTVVRLTDCGT